MENCFWLLSMKGKYARYVFVWQIGSLRAVGTGVTTAVVLARV